MWLLSLFLFLFWFLFDVVVAIVESVEVEVVVVVLLLLLLMFLIYVIVLVGFDIVMFVFFFIFSLSFQNSFLGPPVSKGFFQFCHIVSPSSTGWQPLHNARPFQQHLEFSDASFNQRFFAVERQPRSQHM